MTSAISLKDQSNPEGFRLDPPVDDVSLWIVHGWQQCGTHLPRCVSSGGVSISRTGLGTECRSWSWHQAAVVSVWSLRIRWIVARESPV